MMGVRSWARGVRAALRGPHRRTYWFLAALIAFVVAMLAIRGWLYGALFDYRELDADLYDYGWLLEYVWRAEQGQWVGRDFSHVRGPLWQLLAWIASGFGFHSPGITVGGTGAVFSLLGLAVVLLATFRTLSRPGARLLAVALSAPWVLWMPQEGLRAFIPLLVIVTYAVPARSAGEPDPRPRVSGGIWAGVLATAALLISFERAVMAIVGIVGMAAYAIALHARRPDGRRRHATPLGVFVAALVLSSLAIAALGALVGASYAGYLGDLVQISGSYTVAMQQEFGLDPVQAEPYYALALAAVALAALLALRRHRDVPSGMLLVGSMPALVSALVRSDMAHVFMGIAVLGVAMVLVTLRQHELRRVRTFAPCAAVLLVLTLGFFGGHWPGLHERFVEEPTQALAVARGRLIPDRGYRGDSDGAVAWARDRVHADRPACIATSEALASVHALAEIDGPTGLRWTESLQRERAAAIRSDRCSWLIHRLFTIDHGELRGGWIFGDDFLAIASLYEPRERIGSVQLALGLREEAAPERVTVLRTDGTGRWHDVDVPGEISLVFDRPVPSTALVRLEYTVEISELARLLGGVPWLDVITSTTAGEEYLAQVVMLQGVNRRVSHVLSVDPWTAEWRWIAGRDPREVGTVDRMRIQLNPSSLWTPDSVRMKVHSAQMLSPGAPAVANGLWERDASPVAADLLQRLRTGDASARFVSPRFHDGALVLDPRRRQPIPASISYDLHPAAGDVLEGSAALASPADAGARLRMTVIDPAARGEQRRVELSTLRLAVEPATFELPLDPWAGLRVMLRVEALAGETGDVDRVRIERLRVTRRDGPVTLAGALRSGVARVESAEAPIAGRGDVRLHPNHPGEPVAQVVWPVEPAGDTCFFTGLANDGPDGGDGVWFEVSVVDESERTLLFRRLVEPGTPQVDSREMSLARWSDRRIDLVLATRPGGSPDFDWASFTFPRLGSCRGR